MSRFFPHTPYGEDQPLHHTILAVHVLTRGATTGAIIGGSVYGTRRLRASWATSQAASPFTRTQLLLRSAGIGTVIGTACLAVALVGRMTGREEIEWKDRSWRLMQNKGQLECDDWSYGGAAAGIGAAALSGALKAAGWKAAVGAAGAGSVAGTVGYMAWRYGIKGGKFED